MPETTLEDIEHLDLISSSAYIKIRVELTKYDKDGVSNPVDLTPHLIVEGSNVARNSERDIHSKLTCDLTTELPWTEVILEPKISIIDGISGATSTWRLGQYFVETPVTKLSNPDRHKVIGYDNLSMYNTDVVHTYDVEEDQDVISAMQEGILGNAIDWGEVAPRFRFTPTANRAPNDRIWEINEKYTYLSIANDLLDTIGFRKLFTDRDGAFVSEPLQKLRDKTSVYTIDAERDMSIVSLNTEYRQDTWKVPNYWLGISNNVNRASIPGFDDGLYIIRNPNIGPTSLNTRGRPVNKLVTVDAANQFALISVMEFEAEKDFSSIERINMQCVPLPLFWHETVVNLSIRDFDVHNKKMVAREWMLPFDGSDMQVKFDVLNLLPQ